MCTIVLYMIIVLIKVIAMTGKEQRKECTKNGYLGWGSYSSCIRSFYSSSKIMSKEVNKAFDKELGKYNTLLIYNCHCFGGRY